MKLLLLQIMFLVLFACAASGHSLQDGPPPPPPPAPAKPVRVVGKAKVYYFKNSDTSEVQTDQPIYEERKDGKLDSLGLKARFKVVGQKVTTPDRVTMDFMTQTYEPKFATPEGRLLTIYVDGQRLGSSEMGVVKSIKWGGGNYTEWIAAAFDFDTFKKIAGASKVTMQLGTIKIELKDSELDGLRDMLKTIEP